MKTDDLRELDALVAFIAGKVADAERTLKCREEMERTWRGGTDASWRKVGCFKSKQEG